MRTTLVLPALLALAIAASIAACSAGEPAVPAMTLGESTTEEMCLGAFVFVYKAQ